MEHTTCPGPVPLELPPGSITSGCAHRVLSHPRALFAWDQAALQPHSQRTRSLRYGDGLRDSESSFARREHCGGPGGAGYSHLEEGCPFRRAHALGRLTCRAGSAQPFRLACPVVQTAPSCYLMQVLLLLTLVTGSHAVWTRLVSRLRR